MSSSLKCDLKCEDIHVYCVPTHLCVLYPHACVYTCICIAYAVPLVTFMYVCDFVCTSRESALAEMGIAVRKGETVGVFQPKKVN